MFNFGDLKEKIKNVDDWFAKELSSIRTGRATPAVLDFVEVLAYGQKMSIKELANILTEDAKTIRIEPWDQSVAKEIEKAIVSSNLGLSVAPFEKGLRVIFPELTSERREQFVKIVKGKLEEARASLRSARDKTWKEIEEKEKLGGMGEDDKFRLKTDMQKLIDDGNKKLDEMAAKKEADIRM
ncbi:MAG TPA: ribosome-recycling factor [Candidatus Paceibacterota bacterium]